MVLIEGTVCPSWEEARFLPRKLCRQTDGALQCACRGDTLAHDIESGSVSGGGEDGVEPRGHRHAAVEAAQLGRDLPLVVIHGDDAVIFAGEGLDIDGVGRKWPLAIDTRFCRRANGRADQIDLLPAEEAVFTGMGIECGNGDAGLFYTRTPHRAVNEFDRLDDAVVGDHDRGRCARRHAT